MGKITRTGGHQTEIRNHTLTLDVDTYVGAGHFSVSPKVKGLGPL